MTTRKFQLPVSGFHSGLNTEASVLNVLPSELMDGSINITIQQNGSILRRLGIDFIGADFDGNFLHTVRNNSPETDEVDAECPATVFVRLTAPNGSLVERIVTDINNQWQVYKIDRDGLVNFDSPFQTSTRTSVSYREQKLHHVSYAQSGRRVYFTGYHLLPGYFEVSADNSTLTFVNYDVIIRNPEATQLNDQVKRTISSVSRWFDCIEAHTSDSVNRPGDGTGNWQRYWAENFSAVPSSPATWLTATGYVTQFIKRYDTNSVPTVSDTYPSTVEFFAGRVWLSGDVSFSNEILFSQVIDNDSKINRFYQAADPFDATDANLADDDGGLITIQGAGVIFRLLAQSGSLFIGTNTGIFQISGPDGVFKATNFARSLILDERIGGHYNLEKVDQEFVIFGESSIWLSKIEKSISVTTTGEPSFVNLSEPKIATFYRNIPKSEKASALVLYNANERKLYYFFNSASKIFSIKHNKHFPFHPVYFTNCLVMDTRFIAELLPFEAQESAQFNRRVKGAFYLYEFNDGGDAGKPYIAFPFKSLNSVGSTDFLVDNSDSLLLNNAGDSLVVRGEFQNKDSIMFVIGQRIDNGDGTVDINNAFGILEGYSNVDWASDSMYSISYNSKAIFGTLTGGDIRHVKGGAYLYALFDQTESNVLDANLVDITQGGAIIRVAVMWATSTASPYYGDATAVYFPGRFGLTRNTGAEDGHSHTWFNKRIRGRGNAVQFILESTVDKPFHLTGWNYQFWGKND